MKLLKVYFYTQLHIFLNEFSEYERTNEKKQKNTILRIRMYILHGHISVLILRKTIGKDKYGEYYSL